MKKNIVILIILLFGWLLFWNVFLKKDKTPQITQIPLEKTVDEVEQKLGVTLPLKGEKVVLQDKTNQDINAVAIIDENNDQKMISILADLPENSENYQAYLVNKSMNKEELLGQLAFGKGGYFGDFVINSDFFDFNMILVKTSQNVVLEGMFELN